MTINSIKGWVRWGLILLVALMPFHAFFSVWAGHVFGMQPLWQSWKELLIILLGVLTVWMLIKRPQEVHKLLKPYNFAALAFIALALIVSIFAQPPVKAMVFGLKTDIEFLMVFFIAQLVTDKVFLSRIVQTALVSSGVVIAFGLLQVFLLPNDFLTYFGYGPTTIQPYLKVDPQVESVRILSTLGGPNQLGSYLLIPLGIVLWNLFGAPRLWHLAYLLAGLVVLWNTHSRAAFVGLAIVIAVLMMIRLPVRWRLPALLLATIVAAIALELLIKAAGSNQKLQYYLFHQTARTTGISASTDLHAKALIDGWEMVKTNPFGQGLGTAGPASFQTDNPFIPENYYLQLAVEAGIIGAILFILAQIMIAFALARNRVMGPALIAIMAGIGAINLFLHGWADSSTALVYWSLTGASLRDRT